MKNFILIAIIALAQSTLANDFFCFEKTSYKIGNSYEFCFDQPLDKFFTEEDVRTKFQEIKIYVPSLIQEVTTYRMTSCKEWFYRSNICTYHSEKNSTILQVYYRTPYDCEMLSAKECILFKLDSQLYD